MKLLKIFFFICLFVSASDVLYSQQMETKTGIKGGANLANIAVDGNLDYDFLIDFHAGIFFRLPPIEKVSFQAELLYSRQGADISGDIFGSYIGETVRLDYLSLPLMLRINILNNRGGILVGPGLNYLVNVGDDDSFEGSGKDLRGLYNDFDLTAVFGYEYDVSAGFVIGARGIISLSNIESGDVVFVETTLGNLPYTTPSNLSNVVTQFYIGLVF